MEISSDKKIRIQMIAKGITGAKIARKVDVDMSAINKTIKGRIKSLRLRNAIAEAIGKEVTELWPETKIKP